VGRADQAPLYVVASAFCTPHAIAASIGANACCRWNRGMAANNKADSMASATP
jgi:hypothetical protein